MRVKNNPVLGDMVYEQLKDMILTRRIRCGERVQEQQIEEELGVSRTPVREAVRRLATEGIITIYPNRHSEVVSFDDASIRDLGMVRITLECLAAQLAIQNGSNRDFDAMALLAKQCEDSHNSNDLYEQIRFDAEFHMKLVEISRNSLVLDIQKSIVLRTRLLQTIRLEDTGGSVCDLKNHQGILDALYARDVNEILRIIKVHLCPFYDIAADDVQPVHFSL